jgi:long-chain acyl-CoA synthetase
LLKRIAEKIKDFPSYAQIRRVHPTLDNWTVNNGLLTPTLKVKRAVVTQQFEQDIEKMYEGF